MGNVATVTVHVIVTAEHCGMPIAFEKPVGVVNATFKQGNVVRRLATELHFLLGSFDFLLKTLSTERMSFGIFGQPFGFIFHNGQYFFRRSNMMQACYWPVGGGVLLDYGLGRGAKKGKEYGMMRINVREMVWILNKCEASAC